ncbi:ThiF family adenylyltransferase [Mycobacterium marinum]|uniref:ThiF family adenylyltransferase n=1 Tax=Mycobacterium marinum TaxID=1781 RepID=UPI003565F5AB
MNPTMDTARLDALPAAPQWSYEQAFKRNIGLITPAEQQRLRKVRVAIAGMGGVGGMHLAALARLGIGKFTIADPDIFESVNTNRQYGAMVSNYGRLKSEVMRDILLDINPEAEVRVFSGPIGPENATAFLDGADIFIDGIEIFELNLRRLLFRQAQEQGAHALSAGPFAFSTGWVIFEPRGMSFDHYFDFNDHMNDTEKFAAFFTGMAPANTHRGCIDMDYVSVHQHTAPAVGFACHLASGVMGGEVMKIILGRGRVYGAPYFHQFDIYKNLYVRRRLWGGNRNPVQRYKRRQLVSSLNRMAMESGPGKSAG